MPLTSFSIKTPGLKTLQGQMSYFTLQYFANFSYNDLLTRLFTVFLLKKAYYFKVFRKLPEIQFRGKGMNGEKRVRLVKLRWSFLTTMFILSALYFLTALKCWGAELHLSHKYIWMPPYKPAAQGVISPSSFFPSKKQYFLKAGSSRLESRIFHALLASGFACSTEGWTRNGAEEVSELQQVFTAPRWKILADQNKLFYWKDRLGSGKTGSLNSWIWQV